MNDFQQIKNRLPLLQTITRMTELVKKGPHLERCPLCGHIGCFSIMEDKGAWKCHSCDQGGDIFNFIESYEDLDQKQALSFAANLADYDLAPVRPKKSEKHLLSPRERILEAAVAHYHDHLFEFGGRDYFIEKRQHSEKTLRKMKAGMTTGVLFESLRMLSFSDEAMLDSALVVQRKSDGALQDYWPKGLAVFPVINAESSVMTLTMKDPFKKDKRSFLKGCKKDFFLNHAALSKFTELIVVEGQNDGASLHDIGIDNWIGTAGQPSQDQVRLLKNHGTKKFFYLWFDNDPQKDPKKNEGGSAHTRKVYKALSAQEYHVKILPYPQSTKEPAAKDPDEYIRSISDTSGGDARLAVRQLKENALDPLRWEIALIKALPTRDERLIALEHRGIFKAVNALPDMEQEASLESISLLGFSVEAIQKKMDLQVGLLKEVRAYLEDSGRNAKGTILADKCYRWLETRGRFFRTADGKVSLYYRHTIYEISDNLPFRTIMMKLTGLSIKEAPGKQMFDFLQMLCFDHGELIEEVSWIFTNLETDSVYVNLNSPKNEILRISPGENPVAIPNGTNQEGVLLKSSTDIKPFEFQVNADVSEGMRLLKKIVFENLSCQYEMRYFVLCWTLSFLLLDFNKNRGLLHCVGATASGKSTAASLISLLIYGQDLVGQSSAAASFSEGSHAPLVIQDNIENADLTKQLVNFFLLGANSATKKKRKGGSDSENVKEQIKAMIIMTSIEPIPGSIPELVNRTFDVIFEHRYHRPGFVGDEMSRLLVKKRHLILSSIIKLIAKGVLDEMEKRSNWLLYIQKEFPKHNKARANEFLSLLMVILEAILPYIPYKPLKGDSFEAQARDLLKTWIQYQDDLADETGVTSNNILNLLDGLAKEVYFEMKGKGIAPEAHPDYKQKVTLYNPREYLIEFIKTAPRPQTAMELMQEDPEEEDPRVSYFEFSVMSSELHRVFDRYCKNNGSKNPFKSASALGSRIANDRGLLKKGGWCLIESENIAPYFRFHRGHRYWKFSKRIDLISRSSD